MDPNVGAVVFRINSPGGSATASEFIRHSLERVKKSGKPVIISMGDVTASGGYWISTAGTKLIASPTTITGSIGVFGLSPTFEQTLSLAKIGQGSVSTTWLADANKPTKPLDPRLEAILTQTVAKTYEDFSSLVAQSRQLSSQEVQKVAQGRVWTGSQALNYHLVDQLGYFDDAILLARKIAKLPPDSPVVFYDKNSTSLSSLIKSSFKRWSSPFSWLNIDGLSFVKQENIFLEKVFSKQRDIYAHSLINLE